MSEEKSKSPWLDQIKEWAKDIAIALAIGLVLKGSVADARMVPTPSMVPTVQVGDRIFVEKGILKFTGLKRGDSNVFTPPGPSPDYDLNPVPAPPG